MRLVYDATGKEVKIGDVIEQVGRSPVVVTYFTKPHKCSSSGKVCINGVGMEGLGAEYYVGTIGATWIEREDQGWRPPVQLELDFS